MACGVYYGTLRQLFDSTLLTAYLKIKTNADIRNTNYRNTTNQKHKIQN